MKKWWREVRGDPAGTGKKLLFFLPAAAAAGLTFYGKLSFFWLFLPLFPWACRFLDRLREEKEEETRLRQFLDAMDGFRTALRAGCSAENAADEVMRQLAMLPEKGRVTEAWQRMMDRLLSGQPFKEAFSQAADELELPEARLFADALGIVVREGGDMAASVGKFTGAQRKRLSVREEQRAVLRGKRLESVIMKLMPAVVLWFLRLTAGDMVSPVYETAAGRVLMTVCLLGYGGGVLWERKIFSALSADGGAPTKKR